MTEIIKVKKRDGSLVDINYEKIHQVLNWAKARGDLDISISEVEIKSRLQLHHGIETSTIHKTLTKTAADLITAEKPNYDLLAGRLCLLQLRKEAYDQYTPPAFHTFVKEMVSKNLYTEELTVAYNKKELKELGAYIDHDRDLDIAYAGMKQYEGKYLIQSRTKGTIYETPQMALMAISASFGLMMNLGGSLDIIKRIYDVLSLFKINLPTPIMAGMRSPSKQFSSCTLIESGDSLDSINATTSAIVKYISQRAGVGLNVGAIRTLGADIRGGMTVHTG